MTDGTNRVTLDTDALELLRQAAAGKDYADLCKRLRDPFSGEEEDDQGTLARWKEQRLEAASAIEALKKELASAAIGYGNQAEEILRLRAELAALRKEREWRPIAEAPYLGERFLARLDVYTPEHKFIRSDYAVLYADEGQLWFHDESVDTGWMSNDYTDFCSLPPPPKGE